MPCILSSHDHSQIRNSAPPGLDVYGIGEKKTPDAFRQACKRFIFVENLGHDSATDTASKKQPHKAVLNRAFQLLRNVIDASSDPEGWCTPGYIGHHLQQRYPDFDQRTYGFTKLTDLVRATGKFEEQQTGSELRFRLK